MSITGIDIGRAQALQTSLSEVHGTASTAIALVIEAESLSELSTGTVGRLDEVARVAVAAAAAVGTAEAQLRAFRLPAIRQTRSVASMGAAEHFTETERRHLDRAAQRLDDATRLGTAGGYVTDALRDEALTSLAAATRDHEQAQVARELVERHGLSVDNAVVAARSIPLSAIGDAGQIGRALMAVSARQDQPERVQVPPDPFTGIDELLVAHVAASRTRYPPMAIYYSDSYRYTNYTNPQPSLLGAARWLALSEGIALDDAVHVIMDFQQHIEHPDQRDPRSRRPAPSLARAIEAEAVLRFLDILAASEPGTVDPQATAAVVDTLLAEPEQLEWVDVEVSTTAVAVAIASLIANLEVDGTLGLHEDQLEALADLPDNEPDDGSSARAQAVVDALGVAAALEGFTEAELRPLAALSGTATALRLVEAVVTGDTDEFVDAAVDASILAMVSQIATRLVPRLIGGPVVLATTLLLMFDSIDDGSGSNRSYAHSYGTWENGRLVGPGAHGTQVNAAGFADRPMN